MSLRWDSVSIAVVILVLIAFLLGAQALSDGSVGGSPAMSTGDSLGRAGFAYLTGVRTFAAAVLWNRLDPQFHEYYADQPLGEQVQALPITNMVIALDPQFEDAYYVAAWMLAERGLVDQGVELAALGVENNPDSGELHASYAQILHVAAGDLGAATEEAEIALSLDDGSWRDAVEKHDNYAILRAVFVDAGATGRVAFIDEEIARLDEIIGDSLPSGSHDHDGDGVPDH